MEFAVIQTGGKQYKVKKGDQLLVEKIANKKEKDKIVFKNLLSKKEVSATVLGELKGKKTFAVKFRPRNRYRRKIGHRQIYTKIAIEEIG